MSRDAPIARAIGFLAGHQLPYGEFPLCVSEDRSLERQPAFESSPYATTYVLYSLSFASDPRIAGMADKARRFLAEEMEAPGLWRYYSSRSSKTLTPDLDDTACAAFALRQSHDAIRLGLHLRLILTHRDPAGCFKSFLTQGRSNVCALVNANVLHYLGEREETRAACDFLVQVVADHREKQASLYGVDPLSLYYVLSRAYFQGVRSLGACRDAVVERIRARQAEDGSFGDELATALAVASLCNFSDDKPDVRARAIEYLLRRQKEDGSWPRSAFYIDFGGGFYGSEELTTGFAVEALARAG